MIEFILNNQTISTNKPLGTLVLDFIRYHQHLAGTKIGCREGDCGACTVLVGELIDGELKYKSVTSCLTALSNVHGKHVVTIEGINFDTKLNVVQAAMRSQNATQCGFCTPGFIMSLTGFCLSNIEPTNKNVIASIDGNICRCTGYKSIERAAFEVVNTLQNKPKSNAVSYLVEQGFIPEYFNSIAKRLEGIAPLQSINNGVVLGGGTDLYVQKHDEMTEAEILPLANNSSLKQIEIENGFCKIGGACTVTQFAENKIVQQHFPNLEQHIKLVSSTPIRNIATIAGNLVNASPIGDFSVFLLALNASITLIKNEESRTILLKDFYKGYKQLDKVAEECISSIEFKLPQANSYFNFEKVCKRTYLDIASVNTAIYIAIKNEVIENVGMAAGGVAPFPFYLSKTCAFLLGKKIGIDIINQALEIVQSEVTPISDVRGSEYYKRLLLSQLIKAHFINLSQPNFEKLIAV